MSATQFDDRIFKVVLTYGTTQLTLDGGFSIVATGTKYVNALQDECTVVIANLKKDVRDNLATQLTPFTTIPSQKSLALYAGRVSTGLFLLYTGDITQCMPSQPPNIALTIQCKTAQYQKMNILAQAQNVTAPLSQIVTQAAGSMSLKPMVQVQQDKLIGNYSYSGSAAGQVDKISALGPYDVFVDGDTLVCKDKGVALTNYTHVLSAASGMVGVPEPNEYGVTVRCLLEPTSRIGGKLTLKSDLNPMLSGDYAIYQMGFQVASRDVPFYNIISASKGDVIGIQTGTALGNLQ